MKIQPAAAVNYYENKNNNSDTVKTDAFNADQKIKKDEDIQNAVNKMNGVNEALNHSVRFKIHEDTGRVQINIVDSVKDQIIKQLPSDDILNMVAKLKDYIGLLFDEKR